MLFPPEDINDPDKQIAIANGQFILIKKMVYDTVGGHKEVKDRMMDDFPWRLEVFTYWIVYLFPDQHPAMPLAPVDVTRSQFGWHLSAGSNCPLPDSSLCTCPSDSFSHTTLVKYFLCFWQFNGHAYFD